MKFLLNTLTHWDEPPRARHQVAHALAKEFKVVFVAANKFGLPAIKAEQINDNLEILTPYFPIDHRIRYRTPLLNEFYQQWLFHRLVKEHKDFVTINFDFTATRISKYFDRVVYYCNDSFTSISKFINPAIIARYHQYCESKVASNARFCIGVSELLKENLLKYNPVSIEIPLGGPDIDEFDISIKYSPSRESPIKVGFVGFIKSLNLSYTILNLLLKEENMIITLIGPIEDKFLEKVENKNRLILKGPMTGKDLYQELNGFDVTIAPYSSRLINNDNSGAGTGNKIYQYLAMGKPVVISQMAGLQDINFSEGMIYIASKEKDFPSLINKAFNENNEEKIKKRIEFAKSNTWEIRIDYLVKYLKQVFPET